MHTLFCEQASFGSDLVISPDALVARHFWTHAHTGVWIQWNEIMDWNGVIKWWNGLEWEFAFQSSIPVAMAWHLLIHKEIEYRLNTKLTGTLSVRF